MIHLEQVTKIYKVGADRIRALDGVSLRIASDEFVAVMGPSGSGKSTLLNLLGCLDRPSGGVYRLDGEEIHRLGGRHMARIRNERIGFVFQSFELMSRLSALKNVELPLMYAGVNWFARRRRAAEMLARVGLRHRMGHRPHQLSGGEKQRVAVARALVNGPKILLADEPTGNLDSRTSAEILALFEQLRRDGQTIVMVTHDPSVAQRATRVIEMVDGRICSDARVMSENADGEGGRV